MSKNIISILGPIGSFSMNNIDYHGVQLVDIVSKISALGAIKDLTVEIGSPGGSMPVAKAIRSYLKGIQPRVDVTTKQVGDIASAGVTIMTSGNKRLAAKGINPDTGEAFKWMVHNPSTPHVSGNSAAIQKEADELIALENEMTLMFVEDIGTTEENIRPLMAIESWFTSEQAMELNFATGSYDIKNNVAFNDMSKPNKDQGLLAKVAALLGITLAAADLSMFIGKPAMIDGKPALDGSYTIVGGIITVATGSEVEPAPAAPAPPPPSASVEQIAEVVKAALDSQKVAFDLQIVELKKGITSSHAPVSFDPSTSADDAKEFDRSLKANEHKAMKEHDLPKFQRLFHAKYGRLPN